MSKRNEGKGVASLKEINQNLLIIEAIEGYAYRHNLTVKETYWLFRQYDLFRLVRENYEALHSQDLEESIYFCEDILNRIQMKS